MNSTDVLVQGDSMMVASEATINPSTSLYSNIQDAIITNNNTDSSTSSSLLSSTSLSSAPSPPAMTNITTFPASGAALKRPLSRRPKSTTSPPLSSSSTTTPPSSEMVRSWTPRQQLHNLNDFISMGGLDRLEFWQNVIGTFWSDAANIALRIQFPSGSGDGGGGEPVVGGEVFELGPGMLAHFFHVWATSAGLTKFYIEAIQAVEGTLPATGQIFLSTIHSSLESLLLEGSFLIRQHIRLRILYDLFGRITLMEWQIQAHDEYFLSLRAGHLVAANLSHSSSPFVCKAGFPASVHRMLDVMSCLHELMGPELLISANFGASALPTTTATVSAKSVNKRKRIKQVKESSHQQQPDPTLCQT